MRTSVQTFQGGGGGVQFMWVDSYCSTSFSQTGQFQLIEQGTNTPSNMMMYNIQTEGAVITAFDVSSTYQAISFADSGGLLTGAFIGHVI